MTRRKRSRLRRQAALRHRYFDHDAPRRKIRAVENAHDAPGPLDWYFRMVYPPEVIRYQLELDAAMAEALRELTDAQKEAF